MTSSLARVPPGARYVLGEDARIFRAAERSLLRTLAGWSYEEALLPAFDLADLFDRGLGRAPRTYRFADADGSLLALRPELTTLVARTVATRLRDAPLPIRICYSGEVFRWDRPGEGRLAECWQVGLEHIGSARLEADVEVLVVCAEALAGLGLPPPRLVLGHVGFVSGISRALGLSPDEADGLRGLLDHRDLGGLARFLSGRTSREKAERFCRLATLSGGRAVLDEAVEIVRNAASRAAVEELRRITAGAEAAGLGDRVEVDLGGVAGFDYYSGMTFQVWMQGAGAPVGGGGRYDPLMAQFGLDWPAVGFSLHLDRLARLLGGTAAGRGLAASPSAESIPGADLSTAFARAAAARVEGRTVRIVPGEGGP